MIEAYIEGIFILLITYITIFNISTGHLQHKWPKEFKSKVKKIYFTAWLFPYVIYLYCIFATPSTRPFFLQHIYLGAAIHIVMAIFGLRATIT